MSNQIETRLSEIDRFFEGRPSSYTDFDGSRQPVPMDDQDEAMLAEFNRLRDLSALREPMEREWIVSMIVGGCYDIEHPERDDPMGDHMGRNF